MKLAIRLTAVSLLLALLTEGIAIAQSSPAGGATLVKKGTALKFWLVNTLDSGTAKVGDDVPLRLARPLQVNGVTLLQTGLVVHGKVTRVKRSGPNCRQGKVAWVVDRIPFPDSSTAKTWKFMEIKRRDFEPPEKYPSWVIPGGHREVWKWVVLAPLVAPLAVIEFPIFYIGMSGEGGKCTMPGQEYALPPDTTIVVVVSKDHRVK